MSNIIRRLGLGGPLRLRPSAIAGFDRDRQIEHDGPRIKVLFIVSAGRSGSTLLDRLLGQFAGVESIGELYGVWEFGVAKNVRCGCGELFRDCPLWTQVFERAFGGLDKVDGLAMEQFWRRNDQMFGEHFARLLTAPGRRRVRQASDGAPVLESLYAAIAAETKAELIVDTSKSVFHPYFMLGSSVVDPYVLHLVRDPRGVVFSWTRPKEESGYGNGKLMPMKSVSVSMGWWVAMNWFASRLAADLAGRYQLMRYEDFVADPVGGLRGLGAFCGLDFDAGTLLEDHSNEIRPTHSVWGNPMRFDNKVTIRADERWRTEMPQRERRLVTAMSWPFLRHYDYQIGSLPQVAKPLSTSKPTTPAKKSIGDQHDK